jgi:hypothetical protein
LKILSEITFVFNPNAMNSWLSEAMQHPNTIYDKPCTELHHSEGKQNIKELARAKSHVIPHQLEPTALMQLNSRAVL